MSTAGIKSLEIRASASVWLLGRHCVSLSVGRTCHRFAIALCASRNMLPAFFCQSQSGLSICLRGKTKKPLSGLFCSGGEGGIVCHPNLPVSHQSLSLKPSPTESPTVVHWFGSLDHNATRPLPAVFLGCCRGRKTQSRAAGTRSSFGSPSSTLKAASKSFADNAIADQSPSSCWL